MVNCDFYLQVHLPERSYFSWDIRRSPEVPKSLLEGRWYWDCLFPANCRFYLYSELQWQLWGAVLVVLPSLWYSWTLRREQRRSWRLFLVLSCYSAYSLSIGINQSVRSYKMIVVYKSLLMLLYQGHAKALRKAQRLAEQCDKRPSKWPIVI